MIGAKAIVYPSYYEGFGLPVVDALALGTPVVARNTDVNREVAELGGAENLYLFSSTKELSSLVESVLNKGPVEANTSVRRWSDAAREYHAAFLELLSRDPDIPKIRKRAAIVRLLESKGLVPNLV